MSEGAAFKGLEIDLHNYSGARVLRVVHPERQDIDEHRHDRAYIGLFTLGCYREICDGGEAVMSGPSVVLHPPGRPHADAVEDIGLETLTVEFDPAWLRLHGFGAALDRSWVWKGGEVALAGRRLAKSLTDTRCTEAHIGAATNRFLHFALNSEASSRPMWLDAVERELDENECPSTLALARKLDLHPGWLARAYRAANGEGIHETVRRRRVEKASAMLRRTDRPLADVSLESGFCDQSHMNRSFRAVIGRTPLQVRAERMNYAIFSVEGDRRCTS